MTKQSGGIPPFDRFHFFFCPLTVRRDLRIMRKWRNPLTEKTVAGVNGRPAVICSGRLFHFTRKGLVATATIYFVLGVYFERVSTLRLAPKTKIGAPFSTIVGLTLPRFPPEQVSYPRRKFFFFFEVCFTAKRQQRSSMYQQGWVWLVGWTDDGCEFPREY